MYWGVNLYNYKTLHALDFSGRVLGWTILGALVLLGFSAFTLVVFRRTNDKAVTGSYAGMLLIALLGYMWIGYKVPMIKGRYNVFVSDF